MLRRLAPVYIAGHQDEGGLSVLPDQQDLSCLFIDHDHADGHIVHGEAELAAFWTVGDDALSFQLSFDQRLSAFRTEFLNQCHFSHFLSADIIPAVGGGREEENERPFLFVSSAIKRRLINRLFSPFLLDTFGERK